jgi:predicted amidohydrolase
MSRKLKLATVQMDATPAPTTDRLERAATLVKDAAAQGAQLVVLPELFNVGYEYHERNYALAEPISGQTMTWMKTQAAQHKIHLAGSFMLLDGDEIYNSAFIVAPDGRTWRYDKIYPYYWERAYFREGRSTTVADTDLGKLGMMICWDTAHADLWQRYAGKVDAMVITSCPPSMQRADMVFPNGERFKTMMLGKILPDDAHFQNKDVEDQAGWMQVPVVTSQGAGTFRSRMPLPEVWVAAQLAPRNDLQKYLREAHDAILETGYERYAKIIGSDGQVVARVENDGDGFTVAEVELADTQPQPTEPQPKMRMPAIGLLGLDMIGANTLVSIYREGVRRQWGAHMAPVDPRTKMWAYGLAGLAAFGVLLGYLMGRRR